MNKILKIILGGVATILVILGTLGIKVLNLELAAGLIIAAILIAASQPKNADVVEIPIYDMADINKKLKEEKTKKD